MQIILTVLSKPQVVYRTKLSMKVMVTEERYISLANRNPHSCLECGIYHTTSREYRRDGFLVQGTQYFICPFIEVEVP